MEIRIVKNEQDLVSIEQKWNELAYYSTNNFNWVYKWWLSHKENNDLKVIVAEKDNEIIGIAPLYIENARALKYFKIKKLTFLGQRISDNIDFLIKEDKNREQTFERLLRYITENLKFDLLELNQVNSGCINFDLWQKYASLCNFEFETIADNPVARLADFKSYDEYFNQLSKNHKTNLKRIQNKIKRDFNKVEYLFDKDIKEQDIETVANINIKRQIDLYNKGNLERCSYFTDKQNESFIKDYFCNDSSDSKILSCLKCNDNIIAYTLLTMNNAILTFWNTAFDPDYEKYSPSKLLINEQIKYAFDNNYKYFNFMEGSEGYKLDWSNESYTIYDIKKLNSLKAKLIFSFRQYLPNFMLTKFYTSSLKQIIKNNNN